jgi:hypothetical protein
MHSRTRVHQTLSAFAFAALASGGIPASAQGIVNIDATLYGYNPIGATVPPDGTIIAPFSLAAGGMLNQITLGPGTYTVTNGSGLAGANPDFTAWRYDSGINDWAWNYVIADDVNDAVVDDRYPALGSSQTDVASNPSVENYSSTFTVPTTTVLDFMVGDYYLPDNAGGVTLQIQPLAAAVPEPSSVALLSFGFLPLGLIAVRRARSRRS